MSQPALDFIGGPPPRLPREKRRPLLIGGRAPIARQASADGAQLNAPRRETQCAELLAYIESRLTDGATDAEIERDLGWKPNIVTARRNDLVESGDVVRWPDRRRRSVTSGVPVAVWVASRYAPQEARTAGNGHGNDAEPARSEGAREVETSPGGENPASESARGTGQPGHRQTSGASVTEHVAMLPSAPSSSPRRLTAETVREVPVMTRVVFADGSRGQARFVTRKHELAVYAFDRRELVTLRPEQLEDWRDVEGELRERLV